MFAAFKGKIALKTFSAVGYISHIFNLLHELKGAKLVLDDHLIDEVNKLNEELENEHNPNKVNAYIDRFERFLKEAKAKWPNVGRLGIIPRPRHVGTNESELEEETQMGILKSAVEQLALMVNRKRNVILHRPLD